MKNNNRRHNTMAGTRRRRSAARKTDSGPSKTKSDATLSIQDVWQKYGSNVLSQYGALRIGTFMSCVTDKAETIGQLPVKIYAETQKGRELVRSSRTNRIFTKQPCEYMTMGAFLEMAVVAYETFGAFYAYPVYNDRGSLMELLPFRNQEGVHSNMDVNGNVYYTYVTNDGQPNMTFSAEQLFKITKFTRDGFTPIRPLSFYATTLGIASSQEDNYLKVTTEGITSQMALKTDGKFSDDNARERLREDFKKLRGANGLSYIPIFEQGLTPVSLNLTPQESELFNNRTLSDEQICGMCGVPLHRIRLDGTTKTDITLLDEFYMRNKINPILVKLDNEFTRFLPQGMYAQIDRKAFYAGSPWRLVDAVETEVKGGLATINEGRMDLGREMVEGGDVFAIDNNNVTYGTWDNLDAIREQIYGRATGTTDDGTNNTDNTDNLPTEDDDEDED